MSGTVRGNPVPRPRRPWLGRLYAPTTIAVKLLPKHAESAQQIVGVVALSGLLLRANVVAVVRFALVIRRRNSTLC